METQRLASRAGVVLTGWVSEAEGGGAAAVVAAEAVAAEETLSEIRASWGSGSVLAGRDGAGAGVSIHPAQAR